MAPLFIAFSLTLIDLVLLPQENFLVLSGIVIFACLIQSKKYKIVLLLLIGILLGFARYSLLPNLKTHPENQILGEVVSIPNQYMHGIQFLFRSQQHLYSLSWYGHPQKVQIHDRWRFAIKYNRHQYNKNKLRAYIKGGRRIYRTDWQHSMGVLRQRLAENIQHLVPDSSLAAILVALSLGSRHLMQRQDWQVFQDTGTSHLIAISGLHVGLVAGIFYFIASWLWRRSEQLMLFLPAQKIALMSSLLGATGYAFLSGFAVPAQRALIMLCVFLLGQLTGRKIPLWYRLLFAFTVIIGFDPFALITASCWLSFVAVALIGYSLNNTCGLLTWLRLQVRMFLGLLPLTLYFFHRVSWVMLLANIVAIPYTSFILVPGCLFATLTLALPSTLAQLSWDLNTGLLTPLWWYLSKLAHLPHIIWQHTITLSGMTLAFFGIALILAPKYFPARWLGIVLLLFGILFF